MRKQKNIITRLIAWLQNLPTPMIALERREPVPVRVRVHDRHPHQ